MKKPKLYNSEVLLQTFIKRSSINDLMRYINSMNQWIHWLEKHIEDEEVFEGTDDIYSNEGDEIDE